VGRFGARRQGEHLYTSERVVVSPAPASSSPPPTSPPREHALAEATAAPGSGWAWSPDLASRSATRSAPSPHRRPHPVEGILSGGSPCGASGSSRVNRCVDPHEGRRLVRGPAAPWTVPMTTRPGGPGRVVLVTGGSRGIGLACAEWFLAHGDRVHHLPFGCPRARGRRRSGAVPPLTCDMTDVDQVEAAFATVEDAWGRSRCWWPTPGSPGTPWCCG